MTETVAACLTPPGTAAIASIALLGPSAWPMARGLFRPRKDGGPPLPEMPEPGRIRLGRFGDEAADEVVLAVRRTQPLPWVEVHCHGGRQVVDLLLETLGQRGARLCDAPEIHRLALPPDPLRDVAEACLLRAPTLRTAAILLRERAGCLRVALEAVLATLPQDPTSAQMALSCLARFVPLGRHLVQPWQVTVAGAPNAGKSSLVNVLAGYQRSIVAPTPGTTRDVVTTTIALDGWPVELADTAGLREQVAELEAQGIARARAAVTSADLCLWVLDAAGDPAWPDVPRERVLLVVNKTDLPAAWDLGRAAEAVHVSARTMSGIPELCGAIARRLVPHAPGPDDTVPFSPELCDAVEQAYTHLTSGRIDEARRALRALLEPRGGA